MHHWVGGLFIVVLRPMSASYDYKGLAIWNIENRMCYLWGFFDKKLK